MPAVSVVLLTSRKAGQPWNPDRGGTKQLGDITDNVNIALADTSVLSDFEPPATHKQQNMLRPLQESYAHLSNCSHLIR